MRRAHPLFWLPVLLVFLTGCSTYHRAVLPRLDPDRPAPDAPLPDVGTEPPVALAHGMPVRILLVSGEVIESEVDQVSPDTLTIGRVGNYGWETRAISAGDILRLEVPRATGFARFGAAVLGTIVVTGIALVVLFALSKPDFGGLS